MPAGAAGVMVLRRIPHTGADNMAESLRHAAEGRRTMSSVCLFVCMFVCIVIIWWSAGLRMKNEGPENRLFVCLFVCLFVVIWWSSLDCWSTG